MPKCLLLEEYRPLYIVILKDGEFCSVFECMVVFLFCTLSTSLLPSDLELLGG